MDPSADTSDVNKEVEQQGRTLHAVGERDKTRPSTLFIGHGQRGHHKTHRQVSSALKKKKKKNRRPKVTQRPLLRPAGSQVPRAPENSTQFIMDNHENSNLFYNFDSNEESFEEQDETKTPTTSNLFAVNDFEKAYRSAREERLMNTNMDDLKSAIASLENRCANLKSTIASRPSVLLDNLQSTLIELQEENKHLHIENQKLVDPGSKRNSSDTSSSSYSGSSNSSSDSECSQPDCEECAQQVVPEAKQDIEVGEYATQNNSDPVNQPYES